MTAAVSEQARAELEARNRRGQRLTRLEDSLSEVLALEGMTRDQWHVLMTARVVVQGMRGAR